jgi:hypothetical protein
MSARQDVSDLTQSTQRTCAEVAEEAESELSFFLRRRHVLKTCAKWDERHRSTGLALRHMFLRRRGSDGACAIEAKFLGDQAQRCNAERDVLVEWEAELFGAFVDVVAIHAAGERFVL